MSIVLVTGAFDIIHRGHLELIHYASSLGQVVIATDTDEKIRETKGPDRPYNCEKDRTYHLAMIRGVSSVVTFDSENALVNFCKGLRPDIRVVGSDWKGKKIVGEEHCGQIIFYERFGNYSTTNILKGIKT